MSPKYHRVVRGLALQVLKEAMGRTRHDKAQVVAIRLALRCLWPSCTDKALLTALWDALTREVDIGRAHGLAVAYEAVRAHVEREGVEAS